MTIYYYIIFFIGLGFGVISSIIYVGRKKNILLKQNEENLLMYKSELKRYNQCELELERYKKAFKNKYEDDE